MVVKMTALVEITWKNGQPEDHGANRQILRLRFPRSSLDEAGCFQYGRSFKLGFEDEKWVSSDNPFQDALSALFSAHEYI